MVPNPGSSSNTSTLTTPLYMNAAEVTSCSTKVLGCPFITGGMFRPRPASLYLQAAERQDQRSCLRSSKIHAPPTVFFNNIDMTALLTDQTAPDKWSINGTVPTIGC